MPQSTGVNCIVNIAGTNVPANLQGCSPDVNKAVRPIVLALGLANNLVGYAPSTGAKSGFMLDFDLPYVGGSGLLNSCLNSAGIAIGIYFGGVGGVQLSGCLADDLTVSGQEGGNINVKGTWQAIGLPTTGYTAASAGLSDVFKFTDVASVKLPSGTVYTDVSQFSFQVKRNIAAYRGNSPTGIPKYLSITHTEVMTQAKYLKTSDAEGAAFMAGGSPNYCPTFGDVVVSLVQACPTPGGTSGNTSTLTAAKSFHESYPKTPSGTESFVEEQASMKAYQGNFTIA